MSVDNDDITAQQGRNGFGPATDFDTAGLNDDGTPDMSAMARLLEEQDAQVRTIKRGDVVEGQIVRIDPEEILVDIGLKSEGVLSTKELPAAGYGSLAELQVGTDVLVYIMQPETPEGHAIVSIKRARLERQWRIAQEQYERGDLLEAEVIDFNKGGLIVNLEGIRGFVPISQILNLKREDTADSTETQNKLQAMVGRRLQLKIIEINRNRNRLILSERLAVQEWRAKRREELLNELTVGEVRKGVVSNLSNFGAFVDLGGADGLVHISQLAWSRVNHPSEVLRVGQEVEVQVLSVDKEKKKIALSIKRAEVDPWTTVEGRYTVGQVVRGTITKIAPFGAFARIEDGVEGLIHLSELPLGVQDPKQVLKEGQDVTVRILRIDAERRRLGLSVRQVEEAGAPGAAAPAAEGAATAAEPPVRAPEGAVSAQEPAEGRADTGAPAAERGPDRPAPRREEAPTTAMAAAFAAAYGQQGQQRAESPAAPAAETPAGAPEATAEATAPAAPPAAEAAVPTPAPAAAQATGSVDADTDTAEQEAAADTPEAGAIEPATGTEAAPVNPVAAAASAVQSVDAGALSPAAGSGAGVTGEVQSEGQAEAQGEKATENANAREAEEETE